MILELIVDELKKEKEKKSLRYADESIIEYKLYNVRAEGYDEGIQKAIDIINKINEEIIDKKNEGSDKE